MVGLPASGKTTIAMEMVRADERCVHVARDDFRYMLRGVGYCPKEEGIITQAVSATVQAALVAGRDVVVDNTHCRLSDLNEGLRTVRHYADAAVRYVPIDLEIAVARDAGRERTVGRAVIERMHEQLSSWAGGFDFALTYPREPRPLVTSKRSGDVIPHAAIFDIDGTLANMGDRSPYAWDRVGIDTPNWPVVERVLDHERRGDLIILMSGRDEVCRGETEAWLFKHGIPFDELHMRPNRDQRKDTIVKAELFDRHVAGRGLNVLAVYDDRLSVVRMWHSKGLFTFCVQQGLVEF